MLEPRAHFGVGDDLHLSSRRRLPTYRRHQPPGEECRHHAPLKGGRAGIRNLQIGNRSQSGGRDLWDEGKQESGFFRAAGSVRR